MNKRRKICEIYIEMDEINKKKPSDKELDELAQVINEIVDNRESNEILPFEKIAKNYLKERNLYGIELDRI